MYIDVWKNLSVWSWKKKIWTFLAGWSTSLFMTDRFPENWTLFIMHWVTSFLSTGWCLWCAQWQVSWALDGVCGALSDKFPEHWMVFMMCSVTIFLSTGWCLWCTEWQVSWALDGVCWCTLWQFFWVLDSVYDVLSDNFPEHWMVFVVHWVTSFLSTGWCLLMHSVTSFLSTRWCLWCTQWQISWTLDGVFSALSDKFPGNWTVFMMHSVAVFLDTEQWAFLQILILEWLKSFTWKLSDGHFLN